MRKVLVSLSVVALAGCSGGEELARPPLTRVLDASAYASEETVCGLLPEGKLAEFALEVEGATADIGAPGPSCTYVGDGGKRILSVKLFTERNVLADAYAMPTSAPEAGKAVFGGGVVIAGQPVARIVDSRGGDECRPAVGLSESAGLQLYPTGFTCAELDPVVEAIVLNLAG